MTPRTPADALALTTSALLRDHDVTDLLYRIVRDCARFTGADAAGLLVRTSSGALELLSATSHAAVELELYQAQLDEGPCVDLMHADEPLGAVGADTIQRRWPTVGPAIVRAGFSAVHAYPLNWHGDVRGGINLFRRADRADDPEQAKGVLAHQLDTDMDMAYTALVDRATQNGSSLSATARTVIQQAYRH